MFLDYEGNAIWNSTTLRIDSVPVVGNWWREYFHSSASSLLYEIILSQDILTFLQIHFFWGRSAGDEWRGVPEEGLGSATLTCQWTDGRRNQLENKNGLYCQGEVKTVSPINDIFFGPIYRLSSAPSVLPAFRRPAAARASNKSCWDQPGIRTRTF